MKEGFPKSNSVFEHPKRLLTLRSGSLARWRGTVLTRQARDMDRKNGHVKAFSSSPSCTQVMG